MLLAPASMLKHCSTEAKETHYPPRQPLMNSPRWCAFCCSTICPLGRANCLHRHPGVGEASFVSAKKKKKKLSVSKKVSVLTTNARTSSWFPFKHYSWRFFLGFFLQQTKKTRQRPDVSRLCKYLWEHFHECGIASLQELTRPSYASMHRVAAMPPRRKVGRFSSVAFKRIQVTLSTLVSGRGRPRSTYLS